MPLGRWAAGPLGQVVRFYVTELSVCNSFWLIDFFHY